MPASTKSKSLSGAHGNYITQPTFDSSCIGKVARKSKHVSGSGRQTVRCRCPLNNCQPFLDSVFRIPRMVERTALACNCSLLDIQKGSLPSRSGGSVRTKCPDANLTHNPKSSLKVAIIHRLLEADSFLWPMARPGLLLWWKFALWDLANQSRVKTIFAAAQIPILDWSRS